MKTSTTKRCRNNPNCENSILIGQTVSDYAKKQTSKIQSFRRLKSFASDSALSAGSPSLGWLPAVRFIPCEGDPADKALDSHDRSESENPCDTRLTVPLILSLSD